MNLNRAIENTPHSAVAGYFGRAPEGAINLSLGEPLFQPPESVRNAYIEALSSGSSRYAPVQGLPELLEAVSSKLESENGIASKPGNVLITNGANEAIALAILSVVDRGDEVLICEPSFPAFSPLVRYCMGKHVPLVLKEENGFQPDLEELKNLINRRTKLMVLNTPHNPTGSVFSRETLKAVSEICRCYILVDEVYENLVYGKSHHSLASVAEGPEKVITVNSFSKTYCMCGYRLGYLHASADLIKNFMKLKLYISICSSTPVQMAGLAALQDEDFPVAARAEFRKRRDIMQRGFRMLGMPFVKPDGTFYIFPNISEWGNDREVHEIFLKAGVLTLPGRIFHENCGSNIRFSFVANPGDIMEAIARIEGVIS